MSIGFGDTFLEVRSPKHTNPSFNEKNVIKDYFKSTVLNILLG
jgi:hypothetical protein